MAKAVLTTKVDPSYDDLPEDRYHFPRRYLNAAREALGDWIVYYEPRRVSADLSSSGGRQSYFATARIMSIERDPRRDDHHYAYVKDYLEFDRPVPFRESDFYYESGLQKADGSTNKGSFGRSVRLLKDSEYSLILAAGFEAGTDERGRLGIREGVRGDTGGLELVDRPIIERLSRRPFRDRVFATGIKRAYDNTCAISGLRIINGGGRAEAQAAAHPARGREWAGQPSERGCTEFHLSLDVRPWPDFDRRRLQVAVEEECYPWECAVACEPRPAAATARPGDLPFRTRAFWSIIGSMCSRGDGGI